MTQPRMILGIAGKMFSGKDEAAATIQRLHPEFEIKKYAEKLKVIASLLTGIPRPDFEDREVKDRFLPEWGMTVREILQKLGTNAIRNGLHDGSWILALFADLKESSHWIISDVRFENEVEAIKARNGKVIRINRPSMRDTGLHPSETALDNYDGFDAVINNVGSLEDFKKSVLTTFYNLSIR